jgi:hypothetical protein
MASIEKATPVRGGFRWVWCNLPVNESGGFMSDEWQYVFVTPNTVRVSAGSHNDGEGQVALFTEYDNRAFPWLAPGFRLALAMSPAEARKIGTLLIERAREAEEL